MTGDENGIYDYDDDTRISQRFKLTVEDPVYKL